LLTPDIAVIATDLAHGTIESRDATVIMKIQAKRNYLAAKGHGVSGAAIHELAALFGGELREFAVIAWAALIKALAAMPPKPGPDLQGEIQKVFTDMMIGRFNLLQPLFDQAFASSGSDRTRPLGLAIVQPIYDGLIKQYSAEIALWAAAYQNSNKGAAPASATYAFHGAVGSVQTGANSTAHVVQNIGAADAAKLLDAIHGFVAELNTRSDIDQGSKAQVTALTGAIERELQSENRNTSKLSGLFFGLSAFVQGMAAAPQAYATIQSIAMTLGLM
jgi:hypothetical protein